MYFCSFPPLPLASQGGLQYFFIDIDVVAVYFPSYVAVASISVAFFIIVGVAELAWITTQPQRHHKYLLGGAASQGVRTQRVTSR